MKRATVALTVLTALLTFDPVIDPAEGRVGSGGSSGSRGSRSYSAPRAPSSPVTPSTPPSTSPAPRASTPAPSPSSPRGFLGGWGGALGGFLLGGLLGSLFLGGLGGGLGGGVGMLDLLVVAGLGILLVSFLRRRATASAGLAGYARGGGDESAARAPAWGAASTTDRMGDRIGDRIGDEPGSGPSSATGGLPPAAGALAGDPDEDLARGVAHIRAMDPAFETGRFVAVATDVFTRLQIGWSSGDLAAVRAHLSDEMAVTLDGDLARLRSQGRVNRVEDVQVESAQVTEAWQEYGRDLVTVRFRVRDLDYTLDQTGQLVEGSRTVPTAFEEYWTFVRPVGPNGWRLGAIQQPPA